MTPQEKAKDLVSKYYQKVADSSYPEDLAKQCALIAVDEITALEYWHKVKQEIEKL